jgi:hypothetical protein
VTLSRSSGSASVGKCGRRVADAPAEPVGAPINSARDNRVLAIALELHATQARRSIAALVKNRAPPSTRGLFHDRAKATRFQRTNAAKYAKNSAAAMPPVAMATKDGFSQSPPYRSPANSRAEG